MIFAQWFRLGMSSPPLRCFHTYGPPSPLTPVESLTDNMVPTFHDPFLQVPSPFQISFLWDQHKLLHSPPTTFVLHDLFHPPFFLSFILSIFRLVRLGPFFKTNRIHVTLGHFPKFVPSITTLGWWTLKGLELPSTSGWSRTSILRFSFLRKRDFLQLPYVYG